MTAIWAICDDRIGNRNQVLSVVRYLGLECEVKNIVYNNFIILPNFLLSSSSVAVDVINSDDCFSQSVNLPSIIIIAGRRSLSIARYIKKRNSGKTKIFAIMWPGWFGSWDIEKIFVPAHDQKNGSNIITIATTPHMIDNQSIMYYRKQKEKSSNSDGKPNFTIVIGGGVAFSDQDYKKIIEFCLLLKESFCLNISTSRRTERSFVDKLQSVLGGVDGVTIYDFVGGDRDNPYIKFLAIADYILITGDSISMCSEVASIDCLNKYVYMPKRLSKKHTQFIYSLCDNSYLNMLDFDISDGFDIKLLEQNFCKVAKNSAEMIAKCIKNCI